MLNQHNHTSNDHAALDSLIDDLLHHKRQNSEDSGVGEGSFVIIYSSLNKLHDKIIFYFQVEIVSTVHPMHWAQWIVMTIHFFLTKQVRLTRAH